MQEIKWTADGRELVSQLAQLSAAIKSTHELLDAAARSCLFQLVHRKNAKPMVKLFAIVRGSSISVVSLNKWIIAMAGVSTAADKDSGGVKITFPKEYALLTVEQATEKVNDVDPFWVFAPVEDPFKGFDFDKKYAALMAEAAKYEQGIKDGRVKIKGQDTDLTEAMIKKINLGTYKKLKPKTEAVLH